MIIDIKTVQVEFKYKGKKLIFHEFLIKLSEKRMNQRPNQTSFYQETGGKTQQNNIFSSLLVNILPWSLHPAL